MPREFDCNALMSTVPGDDGGCTCYGCRANRAIVDAIKEERERCAEIAARHKPKSDTTPELIGKDIAGIIRHGHL